MLTEQLGPVPTRDTHELIFSSWMEGDVRSDVVHLAVESGPGIFPALVLLVSGYDSLDGESSLLPAPPLSRA